MNILNLERVFVEIGLLVFVVLLIIEHGVLAFPAPNQPGAEPCIPHTPHGPRGAKRNTVQFRDSAGKIIATLKDPRNFNDANVTLSRQDDLKRYVDELRHTSLVNIQANNKTVAANKRNMLETYMQKLKEESATTRAANNENSRLSNVEAKHAKNVGEEKIEKSSGEKKTKDFTKDKHAHLFENIEKMMSGKHKSVKQQEHKISQLHEDIGFNSPLEPVEDAEVDLTPPEDDPELGKVPLDWKKILKVDDIGDLVKFEDAPKPCSSSKPAEPGANAHDGRERYDKPDGHHKQKREITSIKNTIDDIVSFYKELENLKESEKTAAETKRSRIQHKPLIADTNNNKKKRHTKRRIIVPTTAARHAKTLKRILYNKDDIMKRVNLAPKHVDSSPAYKRSDYFTDDLDLIGDTLNNEPAHKAGSEQNKPDTSNENPEIARHAAINNAETEPKITDQGVRGNSSDATSLDETRISQTTTSGVQGTGVNTTRIADQNINSPNLAQTAINDAGKEPKITEQGVRGNSSDATSLDETKLPGKNTDNDDFVTTTGNGRTEIEDNLETEIEIEEESIRGNNSDATSLGETNNSQNIISAVQGIPNENRTSLELAYTAINDEETGTRITEQGVRGNSSNATSLDETKLPVTNNNDDDDFVTTTGNSRTEIGDNPETGSKMIDQGVRGNSSDATSLDETKITQTKDNSGTGTQAADQGVRGNSSDATSLDETKITQTTTSGSNNADDNDDSDDLVTTLGNQEPNNNKQPTTNIASNKQVKLNARSNISENQILSNSTSSRFATSTTRNETTSTSRQKTVHEGTPHSHNRIDSININSTEKDNLPKMSTIDKNNNNIVREGRAARNSTFNNISSASKDEKSLIEAPVEDSNNIVGEGKTATNFTSKDDGISISKSVENSSSKSTTSPISSNTSTVMEESLGAPIQHSHEKEVNGDDQNDDLITTRGVDNTPTQSMSSSPLKSAIRKPTTAASTTAKPAPKRRININLNFNTDEGIATSDSIHSLEEQVVRQLHNSSSRIYRAGQEQQQLTTTIKPTTTNPPATRASKQENPNANTGNQELKITQRQLTDSLKLAARAGMEKQKTDFHAGNQEIKITKELLTESLTSALRDFAKELKVEHFKPKNSTPDTHDEKATISSSKHNETLSKSKPLISVTQVPLDDSKNNSDALSKIERKNQLYEKILSKRNNPLVRTTRKRCDVDPCEDNTDVELLEMAKQNLLQSSFPNSYNSRQQQQQPVVQPGELSLLQQLQQQQQQQQITSNSYPLVVQQQQQQPQMISNSPVVAQPQQAATQTMDFSNALQQQQATTQTVDFSNALQQQQATRMGQQQYANPAQTAAVARPSSQGAESQLELIEDAEDEIIRKKKRKPPCSMPSCKCPQYPCSCNQPMCPCSSNTCNCLTPPCFCGCTPDLSMGMSVYPMTSYAPDQSCVCQFGTNDCSCNPYGFAGQQNMNYGVGGGSMMPPSGCMSPYCNPMQPYQQQLAPAAPPQPTYDCQQCCGGNEEEDPCYKPCKCNRRRKPTPFIGKTPSLLPAPAPAQAPLILMAPTLAPLPPRPIILQQPQPLPPQQPPIILPPPQPQPITLPAQAPPIYPPLQPQQQIIIRRKPKKHRNKKIQVIVKPSITVQAAVPSQLVAPNPPPLSPIVIPQQRPTIYFQSPAQVPPTIIQAPPIQPIVIKSPPPPHPVILPPIAAPSPQPVIINPPPSSQPMIVSPAQKTPPVILKPNPAAPQTVNIPPSPPPLPAQPPPPPIILPPPPPNPPPIIPEHLAQSKSRQPKRIKPTISNSSQRDHASPPHPLMVTNVKDLLTKVTNKALKAGVPMNRTLEEKLSEVVAEAIINGQLGGEGEKISQRHFITLPIPLALHLKNLLRNSTILKANIALPLISKVLRRQKSVKAKVPIALESKVLQKLNSIESKVVLSRNSVKAKISLPVVPRINLRRPNKQLNSHASKTSSSIQNMRGTLVNSPTKKPSNNKQGTQKDKMNATALKTTVHKFHTIKKKWKLKTIQKKALLLRNTHKKQHRFTHALTIKNDIIAPLDNHKKEVLKPQKNKVNTFQFQTNVPNLSSDKNDVFVVPHFVTEIDAEKRQSVPQNQLQTSSFQFQTVLNSDSDKKDAFVIPHLRKESEKKKSVPQTQLKTLQLQTIPNLEPNIENTKKYENRKEIMKEQNNNAILYETSSRSIPTRTHLKYQTIAPNRRSTIPRLPYADGDAADYHKRQVMKKTKRKIQHRRRSGKKRKMAGNKHRYKTAHAKS